MSENIFRTYDIRGKFPQDISLKTVVNIGRAFGTYFGIQKNVVIGGDVRLSTPIIKTALSLGLMEVGCNVKDIGICTTPTIYFLSANHSSVDFGIMVTASHNPIDYNGIKVCDRNGVSFHIGNFYKEIKRIMDQNDYKIIKNNAFGQTSILEDVNREQYWNYQRNHFHPIKKLKLVVDIGNGTCYPILEVLKDKKMQVEALHPNPDGTFPVMIPDPAKPKCLKYIVESMNKSSHDLGIGFDADGDRVGFVDEKGAIIKPDQIIMLFGAYLLEKVPKGLILIDIKTSRATYEYLNDLGAEVEFTRVGHSWIHEKLLKRGAIFAGELSGHYYFGEDYFGFDDAIFSSMKMMEIIASREEPLSQIIAKLPSYPTSDEIRIPCNDNIKSKVVENVKSVLFTEAQNCITIDGVRAEFDDGWVLVRESGTEPVISIRVEADTKHKLDYYVKYVNKLVTNEISKNT
ncbi:MAG: phosphomannomutase/phosphoglucomutase [Candidatus Hodarchaeales archaeon]|jgi:phosphomannomutase/phosphoglucomutase